MEAKYVLSGLALVSVIGGAVYFSGQADSLETREVIAPVQPVVVSTRKIAAETALPSREEIVAAIPEQWPVFGSYYVSENQRNQMDVFRQLGAVDGEKALDYLMERGGGEHSQAAMGLPHAMGFAFSGWMESDLEGALSAFKGFLNGKGGMFARPGTYMFNWKGKEFYTGLF